MIHKIQVNMCARDALLIQAASEQTQFSGGSPEGHRGIWFYDPDKGVKVEVHDQVDFVSANDPERVLARGRVMELLRADDYPKYCSRMNHLGFRWEDLPAQELPQ